MSAVPSSADNPSLCSAIRSLARQGQPCKIDYISLGLTGQIAAVESGLAAAAPTQCSTPEQLQVLGAAHGLEPPGPMQVIVSRTALRGVRRQWTCCSMFVRTLHHAG